jgi:Helitron helicase-like domain at N-terminus
MMKDIVFKKIFGATKAHYYIMEFQKRDLPRTHLLLSFAVKQKEATFEEVCAEIPNATRQPVLFQSFT